MSFEPDATLKSCTVYTRSNGQAYMTGQIFNDRRKRFRDGEWVRTSPIVEQIAPDLIRTMNSIYHVEGLRPAPMGEIGC